MNDELSLSSSFVHHDIVGVSVCFSCLVRTLKLCPMCAVGERWGEGRGEALKWSSCRSKSSRNGFDSWSAAVHSTAPLSAEGAPHSTIPASAEGAPHSTSPLSAAESPHFGCPHLTPRFDAMLPYWLPIFSPLRKGFVAPEILSVVISLSKFVIWDHIRRRMGTRDLIRMESQVRRLKAILFLRKNQLT